VAFFHHFGQRVSHHLRSGFAKTAKSFRKNCEIVSQKLRNRFATNGKQVRHFWASGSMGPCSEASFSPQKLVNRGRITFFVRFGTALASDIPTGGGGRAAALVMYQFFWSAIP
jgi:hypothetical protein